MRSLCWLLLLLALAGCAAAGPPPATPPPQPTVPAVDEALSASPAGPFTTIGYLYITNEGSALLNGLSFAGPDPPAPRDPASAVWLPEPPPLPAEAAVESAGPVRYLIVRAQGRLSGPGSYGPGGIYPYQLSEVLLEPLSIRELSIPLLLANSGIYDNQPVRLAGQLLVSGSSALLVDRLGSGGVPPADARQIKLLGPPVGEPVLSQLSAGGAARYGPVEVVGIWRRNGLYPLAIIPS